MTEYAKSGAATAESRHKPVSDALRQLLVRDHLQLINTIEGVEKDLIRQTIAVLQRTLTLQDRQSPEAHTFVAMAMQMAREAESAALSLQTQARDQADGAPLRRQARAVEAIAHINASLVWLLKEDALSAIDAAAWAVWCVETARGNADAWTVKTTSQQRYINVLQGREEV